MTELNEVKERVRALFRVGDQERKGFIIKRDMQRMREELSLTSEQLEQVYDLLDVDQRGFITVDTFLTHFGSYLASTSPAAPPGTRLLPGMDQDQFQPLIDRINHTHMLDNSQAIRRLCDDVTEYGSQQLQVDLEAMLIDLLRDLRRQMTQQQALQEQLRMKEQAHSVELRKLFDEMDFHLKDAKSKMANQIEHRLRQVRTRLEEELALKSDELKEMTSQKNRVSLKLHIMKASEAALRRENAKLLDDKTELEESRDRLSRDVRLMHQKMAQTETHEQKKQMASGFRLAQRIIAEEQGLLQQLRILKSITSTLEGRNQDSEINSTRNSRDNDET